MGNPSSKTATQFELTYLRDVSQKAVDHGEPLESQLVAAHLLAAICNELLERRGAGETAVATECTRSHPHEEMSAECQRLTEVARARDARRTAEYWKAEHNAANDVIAEVREILGEFSSEDVQVMARRAIERIREPEASRPETSVAHTADVSELRRLAAHYGGYAEKIFLGAAEEIERHRAESRSETPVATRCTCGQYEWDADTAEIYSSRGIYHYANRPCSAVKAGENQS